MSVINTKHQSLTPAIPRPHLLNEMSSTLAYVALPSVPPTLSRSSFVSAPRSISPHRPRPLRLVRSVTPVASAHPSRRTRALRGIASIGAAIGAAAIPLLPTPVRATHITSTPTLSATHSPATSASKATFSKRIVRVSTSVSTERPLATVQQATQQPFTHSLTSTASRALPPARIIPNAADPFLHKFLKLALLAGIVTCIITAATIAVFWIIQDSLVYKPTKVWRGTPRSNGMPHYEDVSYCTVDGVEIVGWFIKQPPHIFSNARTLVYFHGTDKNASFRLKKVIGFYEKCRCNILLLSYRGYGPSTGKPNERGVRIDAESAFDYLKSRDDVDVGRNGNLWVYGESLGVPLPSTSLTCISIA
ncbi:Protein ABHD13 [Gracilariopsis chorda]|uniref:Protein ABHD13 n=1 Tax=Gracilariopsis chorda TaxID=448386 RepID=A0A2V3IDZ7_9FLOR|nr:Protein ABHD13 [Gracilariopsis chorda]|eukprot:PXF40248.1 Protein ABHD13 [Gracilariopsis chorda]